MLVWVGKDGGCMFAIREMWRLHAAGAANWRFKDHADW